RFEKRTFLIPGNWCEGDYGDVRIEALLSPTAHITDIQPTKVQPHVTTTKITFTNDNRGDQVPRRFVIVDQRDPKDFYGDTYNGYDLVEVRSFRNAEGETWWIFEDVHFSAEVRSQGVDTTQIELNSQVCALNQIFCLVAEGMDQDRSSKKMDVSLFSQEAVRSFINQGFRDGTAYRLRCNRRKRTITLTSLPAYEVEDDKLRELLSYPGAD